MSQFNIYTAKSRLSELIQKAILGEEVIITKNNKPVAKLTALHPLKNKRQLGTAKGSLKISEDFKRPLKDFKDYM